MLSKKLGQRSAPNLPILRLWNVTSRMDQSRSFFRDAYFVQEKHRQHHDYPSSEHLQHARTRIKKDMDEVTPHHLGHTIPKFPS